jgi:16S rRNA (cytosine1402-N4)-methyltransferase
MTTTQTHIPVLLNEALHGLAIKPDGFYIDGTFGRGGHSHAILQQLGPEGRLMVLDKDPTAIKTAHELFGLDPRVSIFHSPFGEMTLIAERQAWVGNVDGILLDLGVSSPQLDEAERGFSFGKDGPLDMRMNTQHGETAAEWLAEISQTDLARVLKEYGEERFSGRIARVICEKRLIEPITTTKQLADIIAIAAPRRPDQNIHPATRSFQAIRIVVNQELQELPAALKSSLSLLKPGGRLAVISFHSLEDRIVKHFIRESEQGPEMPRGLPIRGDFYQPQLKAVGGAIRPSNEEVAMNPRSRSSTLRIAERQ